MPEIRSKRAACRVEKPVEMAEDGMPVWAKNAEGMPICNSRLRKKPDHIRCQTPVGLNRSNGRCGRHGGPSPKGLESPKFKNGKLSRYMDQLPPDMAERVIAFYNDDQYLSLREDIAIAAERARESLAGSLKLNSRSFKRFSGVLHDATEMLKGEYEEAELELHLRNLIAISEVIIEGAQASDEFERRQETVRRLVDTENRRIQGETEQIPAHRALAIFLAIKVSVRTHGIAQLQFLRDNYPEVLKDPRFINVPVLIGQDLEALLNSRSPKAISARSE
jgi:hypothetical protein